MQKRGLPAAVRRTALTALAALAACAPPSQEGGAVYVSVPPQAWFAERLVPEGVAVAVMIPPGASPRTYEPTIRQMRRLSRAELYLAVGHPRFPFERAWLPRLEAQNPDLRVVDTGASCQLIPDDPHLWLSPECARRMARRTAEAVAVAYPESGRATRSRLAEVLATVDSVDARIDRVLAPHRGRAFLVFHPAWGYFARDYGLRQLSVEVGGRHPSPGELASIVGTAREEEVVAIFVQPQFSRESARVVAREIGASAAVLDPLAREWAEGLLAGAAALEGAFREAPGGRR